MPAEETKVIRRRAEAGGSLDRLDRTLLGLLAADASRGYAELGRLLHLSPPAVHERVRRLRAAGVIRGTVARLDPARIGRGLLAFVHVLSEGWGKSEQMLALSALPEVEEIHSVTGEVCMLLKVRTAGTTELEALLQRIYAVPGVRETRSQVVLTSYLERGPTPG